MLNGGTSDLCRNTLEVRKMESNETKNETKERIRKIMEGVRMSQQDFAAKLGISPATLSSIFTGRTNPTNYHVQAIHKAFPEINVSWLLFGEGDMISQNGGAHGGGEGDGSQLAAGGLFAEDNGALSAGGGFSIGEGNISLGGVNASLGGDSSPVGDVGSSAGNGNIAGRNSAAAGGMKGSVDGKSSPSLFGHANVGGTSSVPGTGSSGGMSGFSAAGGGSHAQVPQRNMGRMVETVKIVDKVVRKIREIRVFYDDGTYETFVPSNK